MHTTECVLSPHNSHLSRAVVSSRGWQNSTKGCEELYMHALYGAGEFIVIQKTQWVIERKIYEAAVVEQDRRSGWNDSHLGFKEGAHLCFSVLKKFEVLSTLFLQQVKEWCSWQVYTVTVSMRLYSALICALFFLLWKIISTRKPSIFFSSLSSLVLLGI